LAETYRKAKIENYLDRIRKRRHMLILQVAKPELGEFKSFLQGQIAAIDEVIHEIEGEFEIIEEQ
jgi:hypothetical protein